MNRIKKLLEAIQTHKSVEQIRKLLTPSWFGFKKACNVNDTLGIGVASPLNVASFAGRIDVVKLLLDYGADVNYQDKSGYSALLWAASQGYTQIVEMLINKGADVNKKNVAGNSALIFATRGNHTKMVGLLTLHHAEVNVISHLELLKGDTPLTIAVRNKNLEIVKMLISNGADVTVKNNYEETALKIAIKNRDIEIVKILIEAGVDLNKEDSWGSDALQYAIDHIKDEYENDDLELVKLLVMNGSNLNKQYKNGDYPVKLSLRKGHTKIAEWLVNNGAIIDRKEREKIEMERKNEEDLLRLGYYCATCGCYKSEQEVVEEPYEQDEWITIYYLYCKYCGSKITDKQGNWKISRVKN